MNSGCSVSRATRPAAAAKPVFYGLIGFSAGRLIELAGAASFILFYCFVLLATLTSPRTLIWLFCVGAVATQQNPIGKSPYSFPTNPNKASVRLNIGPQSVLQFRRLHNPSEVTCAELSLVRSPLKQHSNNNNNNNTQTKQLCTT